LPSGSANFEWALLARKSAEILARRDEEIMWVSAWIRNHLGQLRRDQLFTTRDMLSYGKRRAVDSALSRMVKNAEIVRLAWGVFVRADHPALDSITDREVAEEKADAFGKRLMTHQADVAASHGLPAEPNRRSVYQVDGRSSRFRLVRTNEIVILRGTSARKMWLGDEKVGMTIRALTELKVHKLDHDAVLKVRARLNRPEKREFQAKARWMPHWLSDFIAAGAVRTQDGRVKGERFVNKTSHFGAALVNHMTGHGLLVKETVATYSLATTLAPRLVKLVS
jgi:hypothetical protein